MCVLICNSCEVECINKVTESITVLNMFAIAFAVTVAGGKACAQNLASLKGIVQGMVCVN